MRLLLCNVIQAGLPVSTYKMAEVLFNTCKMAEILFSASDFVVNQSAIKSSRLLLIKYAFTLSSSSTTRCYDPI
jgi:hypothetical protein